MIRALKHVALTRRRSPALDIFVCVVYGFGMDRHWLLTNTLYGNWLPGDERGFVGQVWEHRPNDPAEKPRVRHNLPGIEYDENMPGMYRTGQTLLKCPPIHLTTQHAEVLRSQILETATHRGWELRAVAIMFNHYHIVVGVPGAPKPSKVLADFKSWGTRTLTKQFGAPKSETWWTERGSKRKLPNDKALFGAVQYVLYEQPNPSVTWSPETGLHYGAPPR